MRMVLRGAGVLLMACSGPVLALDYSWGDLNLTLKNRFSVGAAFRMEERDDDLIGKLNVPGQQDLCTADDCMSLSGDPAPNQRLVDAEGAFVGHAADDGNLNYDQYDVVAAATKLTSELSLGWGNWQFKARGIAFYDSENRGRKDFHTNTRFQPARTPRSSVIESELGSDVDLYDAFVSSAFQFGERAVSVSVGKQILRWGESTFIALNSLSEINPPDENRLYLPGGQINEIFQPVPLLLVSADIVPNVAAEFFYQYGWRRVRPAAAGGFFSYLEVGGMADTALLGLGQFSEDPEGQYAPAGPASLITSASRTAQVVRGIGEPEDGGQYGLRVNYFAEQLNGGTEFGFYAMNYHSRLPYQSVIAAQDSCMRDSANFAVAFLDCSGFNGSLNPGVGEEPLPVDTLKIFLEYPEDIRLYGISFNTNLGSWSLAGEYAYRPNLPVQVSIPDVIFTGLQPAFPRQDVPAGIGPISIGTIPGARSAAPAFLNVYRGVEINGGDIVSGFERLKVGQLGMTAIRTISSSNPIGADQIILLVEAGATHVLDMPDRDELQFEGGLFHINSHASPGADGSGLPNGTPDPRRLNPTQQTEGFADDFAWGYRLVSRLEYNDVIEGINFKPTLGFFHDVDGIGVFPAQNFIEGRKQFLVGTEFDLEGGWSGTVFYQGSTGRLAPFRDRDFLSFSLSYTF
jgi:hypothetical protein